MPSEPVRKINVRSNKKISILQSLFPNAPKKYFFGGSELLEDMTFGFYGLRNGDCIIALPTEIFETPTFYQWINITKDNEEINDSIQSMLNPKYSEETAKLRDLRLMKIERNPKVYIRMRSSLSDKKLQTNCITKKINIDYTTPDEPSTNALPVLWEL
ncbi:hypothetical protein GPJ56_000042 [Histomonas meleagridis]|uniref:uncharacterized protein n=1 Tax=Histomonas meleagridis TaxID=135588 RepID=UPI003559B13D|nr:hypothetical protein GPJ56_000042 [Histomonas meleagridis]KAH0805540.1 hypothetical protein GO595_001595 [Histomonas meleagridis]